MTRHTRTIRIALPQLSDDGVVDIHDFLQHLLANFESRYADQIHRYYEHRSEHRLHRPDAPTSSGDDPF